MQFSRPGTHVALKARFSHFLLPSQVPPTLSCHSILELYHQDYRCTTRTETDFVHTTPISTCLPPLDPFPRSKKLDFAPRSDRAPKLLYASLSLLELQPPLSKPGRKGNFSYTLHGLLKNTSLVLKDELTSHRETSDRTPGVP